MTVAFLAALRDPDAAGWRAAADGHARPGRRCR